MQKHLTWILASISTILGLLPERSSAQLVFIQDIQLRSVYNVWVPGSVDASGYLNSQLLGVITLDSTDLDITWENSHIDGLDAFIGLRVLRMYYVQGLTSTIVTAWPPSLTLLDLQGPLSSLPQFPPDLLSLSMSSMSNVTVLPDLPDGLVRLLIQQVPGITVIDAFPTTLKDMTLIDVSCTEIPTFAGNSLRHLYLASLPNLISVPAVPDSMEWYQLDDLSALQNIVDLPDTVEYCWFEQLPMLTAMPILPTRCWNLELLQMPQLSGVLTLPVSFDQVNLETLPNLTCLGPITTEAGTLVIQETGITCLPNIPYQGVEIVPDFDPNTLCDVLNSLCPTVHPVITGTLYNDVNMNGVLDIGENGLSGAEVNIQPIEVTAGTMASGYFEQGVYVGSYSLTPVSPVPYVASILPAVRSVTLLDSTSVSANNDFAVTLLSGIEDLQVQVVNELARPGFDNSVWIIYRNNGTVSMSGSVNFSFDVDQSWVSCTVVPTLISGNAVSWSFSDLAIGESSQLHVRLHTDAGVALGTAIEQLATIDPVSSDEVPTDNSFFTSSEVVGSFDPNDKTAEPAEISSQSWGQSVIAYTVHFQNTGSYPAERVVIIDSLSEDLDLTSFRFVGSSHPCTWFIHNRVLRITFDNLMLPDSGANQIDSQGFARFSLAPIMNPMELPISNMASIWFDLNAPIMTSHALVDMSTNIKEDDQGDLVVFPNPVNDVLWLNTAIPWGTGSIIELVDATGRTVSVSPVRGTNAKLEVTGLTPGAFTIRLLDAGRTMTRHFIKH